MASEEEQEAQYLRDEIDDLKVDISNLTDERDDLKRELDDAKERIEFLVSNNGDLETERDELKAALRELHRYAKQAIQGHYAYHGGIDAVAAAETLLNPREADHAETS